METDVKSRIIKFLKYKNISASQFSQQIGASRNYVSSMIDILPRLKRVGFLCASAGRRIRYGLTPAPQFGDAPPKYILSRIEVAVVYLTAFGAYPFAVAKFQFSVHISTLASR